MSKFRVLIKVHKLPKFGTRPIVNCINSATSRIAELIDFLLQPLVKQTNTYIKDTQYLINDLNKLKIDKKYNIFTADVSDLYMNIELARLLDVITFLMKDKLEDNRFIDIIAFHALLSLLLNNNFIFHNKKFYKQTKGIGMGMKAAPALANLFLSFLESKFIIQHDPFFYKRFLDDLLLFVIETFNIEVIRDYFENLKLVISSGKIVNFLDLNISIDYTFGVVKTSLYIKPTQNYNFLLNSSNHPDFIFKNNPKSILIRIRRNCSSITDYFYYPNLYLKHFIKRGYNSKNIIKICNMVANLDRNNILKYKEKKTQKNYLSIFSDFTFDKNFNNCIDIVKNSFQNLKEKYSNLHYYNLKISNSIQPNLQNMLVNNVFSFKFNNKKHFYKKCDSVSCNVCKFSSSNGIIKIKNLYKIPIACQSSCDSTNIVYIIKCNKCDFYYIGESGRSVKIRISDHLRQIRLFKPYEKYFLPVPIHFNLLNHTSKDFVFYIFDSNLEDNFVRLYTEAKLIYLFQNILKVNIINKDIPNMYTQVKNIEVPVL